MNHDGWNGKLYITGVSTSAVSGYYIDNAGATKSISGNINSTSSCNLKLKINFSSTNNQSFDLYFHTREDKVFSGTTVWSGTTFGANGYKN
jgi:hypothetical protein